MAHGLILLILAASPAGAMFRDIDDSRWHLADPPGFSFASEKPGGGVEWQMGKAGGDAILYATRRHREHPLTHEECAMPEDTREFDGFHPMHKTLAFYCGNNTFHYVVQIGMISEGRGPLSDERADAIHVSYKTFRSPVRPGHAAAIRAALKSLSPATAVDLSPRRTPAPRAGGTRPPAGGGRAGKAPSRTWTDAAVQVLAEGSEVVLRGEEAKLFGINDLTPAKKVAHPAADSTNGLDRVIYVAVRPGEGPEGLEATHILLKAAKGKGRSREERFLRVGMNGRLQSAARPGAKRPQRLQPGDPAAVTWFEREAEFHLRGEHRVRP